MSHSEFPRAVDSPRRFWRDEFWPRLVAGTNPALRRRLILATWLLIPVIGAADFLSGVHLSLLVFYFLPVALAVVASGWRLGSLIAALCVAIWLGGDIAAGAQYPSPLIPVWNATIALGTYLILIWLLASLVALHRELERRVRQRTAALTEEIAERERLERAVLEIGERERRSLGRDLHDGLGQHLTGTALVAQALAGRLAAHRAPEAADAAEVVALLEQGIEQTRQVAQGLVLGEIEADNLAAALHELAGRTAGKYRIACEFRHEGGLALDSGAATQLFRIAQEAVSNAARHGRAKHITLRLTRGAETVLLEVEDDGNGLPPPERRGHGLGLRIMAHRAEIAGGRFTVEAQPRGGTLVTCQVPLSSPA